MASVAIPLEAPTKEQHSYWQRTERTSRQRNFWCEVYFCSQKMTLFTKSRVTCHICSALQKVTTAEVGGIYFVNMCSQPCNWLWSPQNAQEFARIQLYKYTKRVPYQYIQVYTNTKSILCQYVHPPQQPATDYDRGYEMHKRLFLNSSPIAVLLHDVALQLHSVQCKSTLYITVYYSAVLGTLYTSWHSAVVLCALYTTWHSAIVICTLYTTWQCKHCFIYSTPPPQCNCTMQRTVSFKLLCTGVGPKVQYIWHKLHYQCTSLHQKSPHNCRTVL